MPHENRKTVPMPDGSMCSKKALHRAAERTAKSGEYPQWMEALQRHLPPNEMRMLIRTANALPMNYGKDGTRFAVGVIVCKIAGTMHERDHATTPESLVDAIVAAGTARGLLFPAH